MSTTSAHRVGFVQLVLISLMIVTTVLLSRTTTTAQAPPTLAFACRDALGQLYAFTGPACPLGFSTVDFSAGQPPVDACAMTTLNTLRAARPTNPCSWFEQPVVLHGPTETLVCVTFPLPTSIPFLSRLRLTNPNGTCSLGGTLMRIVPGGPVAADDSYIVGIDTVLSVPAPGVLGNDALNSGAISGFDATSANGGTVTVSPDGGFTYLPPSGFVGSDSFTYTVSNAGASDSATVSIDVMRYTLANDDEFIINATFTGTVAAPGVLGNDEVNGATISAYDATTTQGGTVTLNADGSFQYTLPATAVTSDTFTYTLTNPVGSSTATVTLNFNEPPTAVAESYTVTEDGTLNTAAPGVLGNDSDPDGDPLTAVFGTTTSHGILALNADGSFLYFPDANYAGSDSFTYMAQDSQGGQSTAATVTITIIPVNDAPTASAQSVVGSEDQTLDITLTGSDVDGDTLSFAIATGPNDGTLGSIGTPSCVAGSCSASVTYTPDANFDGSDSFSFTVSDASVTSAPATISVTVNAVNDAPVAANDTYSTNEDTPFTIPAPGVLGNDTDQEGDSLTAVQVNGPSHGSLTLNADGSFSYTPDADFNGPDSFTYTANDGAADSNVATVNLTVSPVNDAPVAIDDTFSTNEDTALTIPAAGILTNDSDIDGDVLSAIVVSGPAHGSLSLNSDGSFIYTPNANFHGSDSFTYTANDGTADSNIATVSLTVSPVADAPVATNDTYDTDGVATLSVPAPGVLGNDTDADGDDLTAVLVSDVTGGTLTLNADGSFSYTADPGTTADSFTYKANDGEADSNVATVTITINALPVANAQSVSTDEDVPTTITLTASDADDEVLTFTIGTNPANGTLGSIGTPDCSAANTCSATVLYTPGAHVNGTDSFTFTVNDGHADSSAATVSISINAVNDAPSFDIPTTADALEDAGAVTQSPFATGISAGASNESSQVLTMTTTVTGTTGSLSFSQAPSISVVSGNLTFQVTANTFGTATIDVVLIDDAGTPGVPGDDLASATKTFTLTITPVNDAPSFTAGGDVTVNEDSGAYSAAWASVVSAGPNEAGQVLTFNVTADDPTLFSVQPAINGSGTLTFTPATDASGPTTVTVSLSDNGGTANGGVDTTAEVTFTLTITAINDAPSFTAADPPAVNEDAGAQTVTGWVTSVSTGPANESGQSILGYTLSNLQAAATLTFSAGPAVATDGTLTYTPAANAYGTATFDVVVQDNGGTANGGQDTSTVQTFTITVNAVNDAPSFTEGADQTVNEDAGAQTVNPWATSISAGPNESGQLLTFVVTTDTTALFSSQPSVSSNGTLTYTAALNKNGTATVSVKLTDDGGTANGGVNESATQTFTITVNPVNDAPTAATKNYTAQTNMRLSISGTTIQGGGLLAGASDPDAGDPGFTSVLTVGTVSATTPAGGTVTVNSATGTFDFDPPPGVTGNVTFTYTVCDNGNPAPSLCSAATTVTVAVSGTVIWFVDPNAATNGNGTLVSPFTFLSGQAGTSPANDADDVNVANDRIFVHSGTATGGITLLSGEWLIGQGATGASFDALFSISPPAGTINRPAIGGTRPTISPSSGTAVTLNVNNRVQGLNVSAPAGIVGADVDTLVISELNLTSTAGLALSLAGGTNMSVAIGTLSATNGNGGGVSLASSTGTTTLGSVVISNTGGTGLSASSAGTLVITGSANVISTTNGTALTVTNTTIGAADLTFRSISANGGANGIVLTTTGTLGGLTITGTGTVGTGGTIANTTGHGISLTDTTDFSANNLSITGANMAGVDGTEVTNFSFTNGQIVNAGDARTNNLHAAIAFNDQAGNENNVDGTLIITGNLLKDPFGGGVDVFNRSGTISDATISNNTIDSLADEATSTEDGISFNLFGSTTTVASLTKAQIEDNIITDFPSGNGIGILGAQTTTGGPTGSVGTPGSATNRILIDGNTLTGDGALRFGGAGILAGVEGRGVGNFHITNNDVTNVGLHGIATGNSGNTTVEYLITGNDVNANNFEAGAGGIRAASDKHIMADGSTLATPTIRVIIENNVIRNTTGIGIRVLHASSNGSAQVKVIGNDVANGGAGSPAIDINNGSTADAAFSPTMCATISGNTTAANAPSGGGNTFPGILLAKRSTSATTYVFGIVGLTPSPSTNANTEAFLTALNPNANLGGGFYAGKQVAVNVGDNFVSCSHPAGF